MHTQQGWERFLEACERLTEEQRMFDGRGEEGAEGRDEHRGIGKRADVGDSASFGWDRFF